MRKDLCRAKSHGKHLMKQRWMKISLNTYFWLAYQLCATELSRCFAFSKRFAALLGEHCFGNALSVWLAEQSISAHSRSFVTRFTAQLISILYLNPTGHGIWTGNFWEHPPYDVPDGNGNFVSPVLAGFYMFLTMIILLQVKDKNLSVTSKEEAAQNWV